MIKIVFKIIKEYGFKNLLYWDMLFALLMGVIVYLFISSLCREQIITFLGPTIGASASLVAVQISTIALLVSLIQKETIIMLAPDSTEERNLILALGGPFLIGTISWIIGILFLLTSLMMVIRDYFFLSRIFIAFGTSSIVYSIIMIPSLIAFIIDLLNTQAQFLKKNYGDRHG
ncbi:hypothetical protein GFC01_06110 [Desulfofundulus thermobenzoicus]|uniref:Uncharacterized protein n=1 Tax=Desulfofundulus thermobenzoicus TaxID=29376 RepID=A0A6N7IPB6_9FIRM|nr:hypothetical protein [Desulfofundulus thermobenzoicus]MQL51844.1 hypothetical protein [Desulfofundulus thermobenzoicus]